MGNQSSADGRDGDDERRQSGEGHEDTTVEVVTHEEFSELLQSHPRRWNPGSRRTHQMHRVQPQLRMTGQHVYDPVIGPYHHGKPDLRRAEEFKLVCLDWFAKGKEEEKVIFYNKIFKHVHEIREYYAEDVLKNKYDNKEMSLMILLDACFIINVVQNCIRPKEGNMRDWVDCFGVASTISFTIRDLVLLENQIPLPVIKELMCSRYHHQDAGILFTRFLSWLMKVEPSRAEKAARPYLPLHLLEACWRVVAVKDDMNLPVQPDIHNQSAGSKFCCLWRKKKKKHIYSCLSVTDLKAKGIHFNPSSSSYLQDITFNSFYFYGQLQLPILCVSNLTSVMFSNMIAYELSPTSTVKPVVLTYTFFMKSLIESPEDVKELQDRGIIWNSFANHEQVVNVFKGIETFGFNDGDIISVRQRINDHCRNKARTWMVDLIHTKFRTPWTVIALIAATFLLCITFVQTYFTIRPVK